MGKSSTVVIADAGPIIHLDELACIDILFDFGSVIVPEAVWLEIQCHRPQVLDSADTLLIRQRTRQFSPLVNALAPLYSLHAGEQEALHLCMEFSNSLLLTDDTAARQASKSLGVSAHGTLGLLVRAIRQHTRSKFDVLELLRSIPTKTSLHIRPSLLAEVIKQIELDTK